MVERLLTFSWGEDFILLLPAACAALVLGRLHALGFLLVAPFMLLVVLGAALTLSERELPLAIPACFAVAIGGAAWLW
jgi:hypothetical protein